jgi:hypothetical protein
VGEAPAGIFDLMRENSAKGIFGSTSHTNQNHVTHGPESLEAFGTSSFPPEQYDLSLFEPRSPKVSFPLT